MSNPQEIAGVDKKASTEGYASPSGDPGNDMRPPRDIHGWKVESTIRLCISLRL